MKYPNYYCIEILVDGVWQSLTLNFSNKKEAMKQYTKTKRTEHDCHIRLLQYRTLTEKQSASHILRDDIID